MELVFVSCAQFNITNTSYVVITELVSLGCHEYWWNWDTDFVDCFFKVFLGAVIYLAVLVVSTIF